MMLLKQTSFNSANGHLTGEHSEEASRWQAQSLHRGCMQCATGLPVDLHCRLPVWTAVQTLIIKSNEAARAQYRYRSLLVDLPLPVGRGAGSADRGE